MKLAVLYDYFGFMGGAERLALTLARELDADVVTTAIHDKEACAAAFPGARFVELGGIVNLPLLKQVTASLRFAFCDLKGYDAYILCGTWTIYAARKNRPNLVYVNSPPRLFYDLYEDTVSKQGLMTGLLTRAWVHIHRPIDRYHMRFANNVISNSENVQRRVRKFYGVNSRVVHCPTDTKNYSFQEYGDFWLSVNRLYPQKRVELQMDAFRLMPKEKLIVVGGVSKGDMAEGYIRELLSRKPENVEITGTMPESRLKDLYSRCKGLICTAQDEDFGMTPVEAIASGKPVVAVDEGGYRETIIDGVTGRLVAADAKEIAKAVQEVGADPGKYKKACLKRAEDFDTAIFINEIRAELSTAIGGSSNG